MSDSRLGDSAKMSLSDFATRRLNDSENERVGVDFVVVVVNLATPRLK